MNLARIRTRHLTSVTTTAYQQHVQSMVRAGMIPGWWRFRETSGTVVANSGWIGAVADGTWTPGTGAVNSNGKGSLASEAYTFDGTASRVAIPTNAALKSSEFTIGCLVNPSSGGESGLGAFFNYADAGDTAGRFNFNSISLTFTVGATSGGSCTTSTAGSNPRPVINDWQWLFFRLGSDKLPRIFRGYQNTLVEFVYTSQTAWSGTLNPNALLNLGNNSGQSRTFAGLYDEAFFANFAMSNTELLTIIQKREVWNG